MIQMNECGNHNNKSARTRSACLSLSGNFSYHSPGQDACTYVHTSMYVSPLQDYSWIHNTSKVNTLLTPCTHCMMYMAIRLDTTEQLQVYSDIYRSPLVHLVAKLYQPYWLG